MAGDEPGKIRVAIVGGGCAGLAAAWQLSQQPGYEIHVYEKSWRLGGKGASARAADGRILEHGLHVWFGFYENAFKMMRECYAEVERRNWGPKPDNAQKLAHGRIEDAFFPEPNVGVADPAFAGEWAFWSTLLPPAEGLPGTPLDERTNPFTLANYLVRCFGLLKSLMLSVIGPPNVGGPGQPATEGSSSSDETGSPGPAVEAARPIAALMERMTGLLRVGSLTSAAVLLQAVSILEVWLRDKNSTPGTAASAIQLAEALAGQTRKLLLDLTSVDAQVRTKTEIIDIVMTIAVGLFRDRVLFDARGLDAINNLDYRAWLRKHGATNAALELRFLAGTYDLVFGYQNGDRSKPAFAAGVAVRGALRMFFTYRGAMFWRMGSGMGDAVFAPLYRVLLAGRLLNAGSRPVPGPGDAAKTDEAQYASPVEFHLLHELSGVGFSVSQDSRRYVTSVEFMAPGDSQALDLQSKDALDKFGCWPETAEARFGDAIMKERIRKELVVGDHFDRVIFAIGIDDFNKAGAALLPDANSKGSTSPADWKAMSAEVKTVATKSAQVWVRRDLEGLGWDRGSALITALGLSFGTWADMTPTLTSERAWRGQTKSPLDEARSVAYFCDVVPDAVIETLATQARSEAVQKIRDKLIKSASDIRAMDADRDRAASQSRAALRSIVNVSIPNVLHGAVDAVLSKLLASIAKLGASATPEQISDRLAAASASFESDLIKVALERHLEDALNRLLAVEMRPVWPLAFADGCSAIDLEISRHLQANVAGSDRYTQSLPSATSYRISPLDRSVENMAIAGDWTACGLDVGCVEAAVMSGMLAAYAISGKPNPRSIIGYDHP